MRTENEMYNLILEIAKNDDRIKAVYMNGSRTNENVPKDIFQDYDIVYVAEDTKSFICSILMKTHIIQVIRKIRMDG